MKKTNIILYQMTQASYYECSMCGRKMGGMELMPHMKGHGISKEEIDRESFPYNGCKYFKKLNEQDNSQTKKKALKKISKKLNQLVENKSVGYKQTIVTFDKSTSPFDVAFSERGFEINETRLSFEFLETALSKDVNIVLQKGNGLMLDAIKMQKILKYKDLYSNSQSSHA